MLGQLGLVPQGGSQQRGRRGDAAELSQGAPTTAGCSQFGASCPTAGARGRYWGQSHTGSPHSRGVIKVCTSLSAFKN